LPHKHEPTKTRNNTSVRQANVQGDVHIRREFVEPHYEKEEVKVEWTDAPAQRHTKEAIYEPTKYVNHSRTQNVTA